MVEAAHLARGIAEEPPDPGGAPRRLRVQGTLSGKGKIARGTSSASSELMREVGFGIPVMPQGAFYVFADASKWTDDSYAFDFELLERRPASVQPRASTSGKPARGR